MVPGQVLPEGPFGEWMGYYSDDSVPRPYVNVKTILHRNNPILCCAPQHKPVDETGLLKGIAGAANAHSSSGTGRLQVVDPSRPEEPP